MEGGVSRNPRYNQSQRPANDGCCRGQATSLLSTHTCLEKKSNKNGKPMEKKSNKNEDFPTKPTAKLGALRKLSLWNSAIRKRCGQRWCGKGSKKLLKLPRNPPLPLLINPLKKLLPPKLKKRTRLSKKVLLKHPVRTKKGDKLKRRLYSAGPCLPKSQKLLLPCTQPKRRNNTLKRQHQLCSLRPKKTQNPWRWTVHACKKRRRDCSNIKSKKTGFPTLLPTEKWNRNQQIYFYPIPKKTCPTPILIRNAEKDQKNSLTPAKSQFSLTSRSNKQRTDWRGFML